MALCKANNYVIVNGFGGLIAVDVITVILIIIWKLFFPRMEAKQIKPAVSEPVKKIQSIKELE